MVMAVLSSGFVAGFGYVTEQNPIIIVVVCSLTVTHGRFRTRLFSHRPFCDFIGRRFRRLEFVHAAFRLCMRVTPWLLLL